MLNRKYRLTDTKEFQRIYRKGYKAKGEFGMMIFLPTPPSNKHNKNNKSNKNSKYNESNKQQILKFGIVANKKVGNAVQRQKIKRQVRGIIQEHLLANTFKNTSGQFSYILFKRAINQKEYQQLKTDITNQFNKFNLNNMLQ